MDADKQKKRNLIMFPLGTIGRDMVYNLFTNYMLTFILFTRVLTSAQLGAITAIMVAARVFDALNDPIMGNIIERTRTRWGKFKPWLLIGILSTSVVVYAAFNTKLQGWSFVWFFGFIYFMYSITYTMNDISYWGMIPALSSDANSRNQFTSRTTLFAGIGGTLASILIPILTTGKGAIGGSTATAYGIVALVICILSPAFLCFTLFGVRENRSDMAEPAPRISLKMIARTIAGNDQLLWISLIFLIQQIGNGIIAGGMGSTYIYFEFGYQGGLYSLFTTIGMAATAFLMIFYPAISRKIHRKKLMGMMQILSIGGYAMMLIAGLALPSTMLKFYIITIGYMLSSFGQYCFYLIMMISIINTVEYNELEKGTRSEAIIASLRPFLTKLGSAIIVAITSASYLIFGVTKFTNSISELENEAAMGLVTESDKLLSIENVLSNVQNSQTIGLLLSMTVLPCALMLISYFLYIKHYKLDEEEYERICRELEIRKAEAK
ncbi:MAG: glycoside-pentoside-hexuronide (GPH):cation symporter [Sphaerochaetaceae bacterium]|nr:glycoside-pentoside-hexuronide (GPH):cation symporter [Sphaerochaetaceae bacterium]